MGKVKDKKKDKRAYKWTFLIYKKSIPKNYKEILDNDIHVPYMLSPWHDKDLKDPETGEVKPAHKHGVLYFDSLKSYSQVSAILEPLKGPKYVEPVLSTTGMYDYFTHAANPEKAQYDIKKIEYGCGFNLSKFLAQQNSGERITEVLDLIVNKKITEFSSLVDVIKDSGDPSLLDILVSKAFFFSKYIDSKRNKLFGTKR